MTPFMCAQILWAATGDLQAGEDTEKREKLKLARDALARIIYTLDGRNCPHPIEPAPADLRRPEIDEAWRDCLAIAKTQESARSVDATYAVIARSKTAAKPDELPAEAPTWPTKQANKIVPDGSYGPFAAANAEGEWRIFVYQGVDRGQALQQGDAQVDPGIYGYLPAPVSRPANPARPRKIAARVSLGMSALLVLLGLVFVLGLTGWRPLGVTLPGSLAASVIAFAGAFAAAFFSFGYATKGRLFGAVIDGRNRFSLWRAQLCAWTIVLLGSFFGLTLYNVFVAGAALISCGGQPPPDVCGPFPAMQPELWLLLGIVTGSGVLSNLIKSSQDSRTRSADRQLDRRSDAADAEVTDLYTGELREGRHDPEVSRVQQIMITALLLVVYVGMVFSLIASVDGTDLIASMPEIGPYFVGLLAFSHAGYITFKALGRD